jgi:hypothetical protein
MRPLAKNVFGVMLVPMDLRTNGRNAGDITGGLTRCQ